MKNFWKMTEEFIPDSAVVALEGVKNPTAGSDDSPMYIDIITDKFIDFNAERNKMIPVTNATAKERGGVFTSDGVFSPYIFGVTPDERRTKFSYIDIGTRVFHPYIYQILSNVIPKNTMSKIVAGQGSWSVDKDGQIEEILETEPNYDPEATGIDWLIDHWDDFKWKRNSSRIRDQRVKLLASYKKEDIVITKWLVIPVFYREIQTVSGIEKTPDIDKWYCDLIRYAQFYQRSPIPSMAHNTKFMIQQTLLNIRKYGQSLVQLKHGFFKKSVLGKSIDYGYRSVISCVNMDMYDTPDDNPIDMYSTGFPLAQLCVMGFPFMKAEVLEFMRQLFEAIGTRYPIRGKDGKVRLINLDEPMSMYTEDYVQKQIDLWINTPGVRFRPVMIPTEEGEFPFRFPGDTQYNPKNPDAGKDISNRVFTWTDLLYICANNCLADKHVYITRYPLTDYFGIFPSRVFILSTLKTTKMTVMGKEYKYYPVIDPSLPESRVSTLFVDTVTMSVPYLKGLGGDYDGDQITEKMVFTQEANEEAEKLLKSPKHYITEDQELIRVVQNESYLTFYNLTKAE